MRLCLMCLKRVDCQGFELGNAWICDICNKKIEDAIEKDKILEKYKRRASISHDRQDV